MCKICIVEQIVVISIIVEHVGIFEAIFKISRQMLITLLTLCMDVIEEHLCKSSGINHMKFCFGQTNITAIYSDLYRFCVDCLEQLLQ